MVAQRPDRAPDPQVLVVECTDSLQDFHDGIYVLILYVFSLDYEFQILTYVSDGIAGSITIAILNYILLGWEFPVDGYYLHSFEIWLATTVVFYGSGNLGFTLLEYRLGERGLLWALFENILWIPFL